MIHLCHTANQLWFDWVDYHCWMYHKCQLVFSQIWKNSNVPIFISWPPNNLSTTLMDPIRLVVSWVLLEAAISNAMSLWQPQISTLIYFLIFLHIHARKIYQQIILCTSWHLLYKSYNRKTFNKTTLQILCTLWTYHFRNGSWTQNFLNKGIWTWPCDQQKNFSLHDMLNKI